MNVDEDLMMAMQTLKNRGLDTHEKIVHSSSATALGIHIDPRHMLVSVAPMRLWRLKHGLRWALRCRALPGKTWEVLLGRMTFVALLRRDVLSVPFPSISSFGRITMTLRDSGQLPEPKCKLSSAFCRELSAAGHLIGAHPLWQQMQVNMVSVCV